MMMPANYSVIAENEMTYVNGGANAIIDAIGSVTAPIWDLTNVKTFTTNLVTIIGNQFVDKFVNSTIGVVFSGNATWKEVGKIPATLFGGFKGQPGDAVANALGVTAAIYNLGRADVKNIVKDNTFMTVKKLTVVK